jgi:4-hydroxy-2-oxoheptanedioate aldolase
MALRNRTLRMLRDGKPSVGTFVSIGSYDVAELLSRCGLDWLLFDMEHGAISFHALPSLLAATSGGDATPLARLPWNDPVSVKLVLDSGAQGILFPQISTEQEALSAVQSCKYSPEGTRGVGPRRASMYYTDMEDYLAHANEETMVMLLIESKQGVERIDKILEVKGVDAIMIGPGDLAASLGYSPALPERPQKVSEYVERVREACAKRNMPLAISAGSVKEATEFVEQGYLMVSLPGDIEYIARVRDDAASLRANWTPNGTRSQE